MNWLSVFTTTFRRGYQRLDKPVQEKVDLAIENPSAAEAPSELGHKLHGSWEGALSYEIGRQHRIVYMVDFKEKSIVFLAVGTHKIY